jgi:hypothetical protein
MNAFELRFAMLSTAKEMLESEYLSKKAHDEKAIYPTLEDILERAKKLNDFVSDK